MTVFGELLGQQVVILAGRYIWRGKLVSERGPFGKLEGAHQVTAHSMKKVEEEAPVAQVWINAAAIEAIYPASAMEWSTREKEHES